MAIRLLSEVSSVEVLRQFLHESSRRQPATGTFVRSGSALASGQLRIMDREARNGRSPALPGLLRQQQETSPNLPSTLFKQGGAPAVRDAGVGSVRINAAY